MFGFKAIVLAIIIAIAAFVILQIVNLEDPQISWRRKNLKSRYPSDQKGFTLLELMAVLVIMSMMISITIKKFDLLSQTTGTNVLKTGIRELNTRELLTWTKIKLSDTGWLNDAGVFNGVDKNIGQGYEWNPGPTVSGGTLHYKFQSVDLTRTASTRNSAGSWEANN